MPRSTRPSAITVWLREYAGLPENAERTRPRRYEIELVDLDEEWTNRAPLIVDKRPLLTLRDVRHQILTALVGEQVAETTPFSVRLFHRGQIASGGAFRRSDHLHYQVVLPSHDSASLCVDMKDETHELSIAQLAEIKRRIETGISVHDLQELISAELNQAGTNEHLDPSQIELRAIGGLRPGSIPGRNWYVSMVASAWFCQKLCVRVRPPNQQIIIQALNQEYIFSRPKLNPQGTTSARSIRNWFLRRVVLTIKGSNSWNWEANREDITCHERDGGTQLHDQSRIAGGATVTIALTRDVAARYIEAEASMVPDTRICVVCGDNKRPSDIPTRITAACEHANEMCKNCVEQWIASSLEGTWDRMRCPQCPRRLQFIDVAALADRATFARYDDLVTRTFLASLPDFRWCINPRCEAGELYAPDCLRARCNDCKRDMCVQHSMPWHQGETCSQFDDRNSEQREGEEASREVVQSSSKACPSCNRDVHKYEGCNHITCLCGHQWCYLCLAPYADNREGFPVVRHAPDCGR